MDKLLMIFLIILFLSVAVYGYRWKEPDLASATIDLLKQVLAAYLILTNAHRLPFAGQNGGNNGTTTVVSSTPSIAVTPSGGVPEGPLPSITPGK
jgi:hypothetical protein